MSFAHLLIGLVFFFFFCCRVMKVLSRILGAGSLFTMWSARALSQSVAYRVACHFILLAVFFRVSVLNFNEVQFSKFFFSGSCI